MGNGVGDNQLLELRLVKGLDSVARQDAVSDDGNGGASAVGHDDLGGLAESTASVGHVIDDDGITVLDVADENHSGDFVGTSTLLVDEGEAQVKAIGDGCSSIQRIPCQYVL